MLTLGVSLMAARWRTRSEERANQAACGRGCMFAPSALGRKGNQLTLAVPITVVRLMLNHPAPLPAMRILPPSADVLRPPASAPVIRTHCVSVCLARLRLQSWFLAPTSILLRTDRSVRLLPSSVGTCFLDSYLSIRALATDSRMYMSC